MIHVIGILIFIVFPAFLIFSGSSQETVAKPAPNPASCAGDIKCWDTKYGVEASFACSPVIERQAVHAFRWTDKMLEPKFRLVRWLDADAGTFVITGDRIEFQNGFGAWTPITYRCSYDPAKHAVIDVDLTEGRLPQ